VEQRGARTLNRKQALGNAPVKVIVLEPGGKATF
jgi:hypothetical protein